MKIEIEIPENYIPEGYEPTGEYGSLLDNEFGVGINGGGIIEGPTFHNYIKIRKTCWKPKKYETYFAIYGDGTIAKCIMKTDMLDDKYIKMNNYFKTMEDAEKAVKGLQQYFEEFKKEVNQFE